MSKQRNKLNPPQIALMGGVVALTAIAILLSLVGFGQESSGSLIAEWGKLRTAVTDLVQVSAATKTSIPLDPDSLVRWDPSGTAGAVLPIGGLTSLYQEEPAKALVDRWGNSVIVIAYNGSFAGLASAGADGLWSHGSRDDLVCYIGDAHDVSPMSNTWGGIVGTVSVDWAIEHSAYEERKGNTGDFDESTNEQR